jgi:hypothetical protein
MLGFIGQAVSPSVGLQSAAPGRRSDLMDIIYECGAARSPL